MRLSVKLEVFEGPLDLLLHLLDKNKVNIYDIPIAEITDQYMDYVNQMKENVPDMELMSDFLVMAATLLEIKSRMLLPAPEKDEEAQDPREELTARLLEYRIYRNRARELKKMDMGGSRNLFWEQERLPKSIAERKKPLDLDQLLDSVTMSRLQDIFHMVMKRQIDRMDPVHSQFGNIRQEKIRLADRVLSVMRLGREQKQFSFFQLLVRQEGKEGVIVTFLACLELIRMGNLKAVQENSFEDIRMEWQETDCAEWNPEEWKAYS